MPRRMETYSTMLPSEQTLEFQHPPQYTTQSSEKPATDPSLELPPHRLPCYTTLEPPPPTYNPNAAQQKPCSHLINSNRFWNSPRTVAFTLGRPNDPCTTPALLETGSLWTANCGSVSSKAIVWGGNATVWSWRQCAVVLGLLIAVSAATIVGALVDAKHRGRP